MVPSKAMGATYELANETLVTDVMETLSQILAIGVSMLSVIPNVGTPCFFGTKCRFYGLSQSLFIADGN